MAMKENNPTPYESGKNKFPSLCYRFDRHIRNKEEQLILLKAEKTKKEEEILNNRPHGKISKIIYDIKTHFQYSNLEQEEDNIINCHIDLFNLKECKKI